MINLNFSYTVTNMKDTVDNKTIDMLKTAAKTNGERQREYRQRQKQECGKRIDMRVDLSTYNRLESLSLYGNESMKNVLMRLVEEEYIKQLNDKNGKFDAFLRDLHNADQLPKPTFAAVGKSPETFQGLKAFQQYVLQSLQRTQYPQNTRSFLAIQRACVRIDDAVHRSYLRKNLVCLDLVSGQPAFQFSAVASV